MGKKSSPIEKMETKEIRKELAKKHGYSKEWAKTQPRERLVKMLMTERNTNGLLAEVRKDLVETYGYDPEYVAQQTESELIRQRSLEEAGAIAKAKDATPSTEPEPKPKRKSRAKKPTVDETVAEETEDLDAEIAELLENQPERVPPLLIMDPDTYDYMFDGHAGAGPSGAERWMTCPASLQASREFLETLTPNQQREFAKANIAARQGTTAHGAAESKALLMLGRIDENEHEHNLLELANMPETAAESYDEEMSDFIEEYVDLVEQYADERGKGNILIEHRVKAPVALVGKRDGEIYEISGSADFVGLPTKKFPSLVVGDLKYGQGYEVEVKENKQERIYALGVLASLCDDEGNLPEGLEKIIYYVAQPRLGGISQWEESVEDLLAWVDDTLAPALTLALDGVDGGAEFNPEPAACQWCPARGTCPALAAARMEQAVEVFDVITEHEFEHGHGVPLDGASLPDATLGELLQQIDGLIDLQKDLKAEVQRRLHRGREIPGYHLVSYTPKREWSEGAAEELAEVEEVWQRKMLTPTQAIKAVEGKPEAKALVDEYVIVPDKRPLAAPVTDRRKKWEGKAPEEMFDKIEGDE